MIFDRSNKIFGNSSVINSSENVRNTAQPLITYSSQATQKPIASQKYSEMGSYNMPMDEDNTPNVQNHTDYTIRALADMFKCRLSNFPMTVGIFTQQNNKEYLSQLANELHNMDRLDSPLPLKFSKLLFLFPLFISAILGYFVGMLTNWQIGLSIGHIGMFIQITFLALIITGSRFCHKPMAIRASYSIAYFLHWLKLFLSICFCYPVKSVNAKTPARIIVVYHRICPTSTTNMALFSLIEKMWFSLVRHYGQILVRLQKAGKPSVIPNCKYKRVCCLPAFVVMIAFWIALFISTSIMRLYSGQLTNLLGHGGLLSLFVIMSSIMFLSFFGSLPSLCRIFKGLLIHPMTPVKTALSAFVKTENDTDRELFSTKTVGKINEAALLSNSTSFKDLAISAEEQRACKADLFIKSEFAKICNLSVTFDRFTSTQQTRFILCLDASSTIQKDLLAKLIYQIHNLILSDMNAPVAIVLEANFRILLGDLVCSSIFTPRTSSCYDGLTQGPKFLAQILSDNFHLVHASLHLPIYLEPPIFSDFPQQQLTCPNDQLQQNQVFHSPLNGYSSAVCASQTSSTVPKTMTTLNMNASSTNLSFNRNSVSTHLPRATFDNCYESRLISKHASKHSTTHIESEIDNNDFTGERNNFSVNDIASMFLYNHELADWNGKVLKQLVLSTALTSRLLKFYNMNVEISLIVVWVTLVHHWPYHTAWLIIYLEDLNASSSMNTNKGQDLQIQINLLEAFSEVKKRVGETIEKLEPLAAEDRDLEQLNKFLYAKASTPILLNSLKQLIACTLTHNPFIRQSVLALAGNLNERQRSTVHHSFVNPLDALNEEMNNSVNYSSALNKVVQSSSVPLYATIQLNASRTLTNQIGCTTTGSLSSADNVPSNPSWPCSSDTFTTGDNAMNKPSALKLKKKYPLIPLNQFTVNDVCELFSSIADINPSHMQNYLTKIKQLKINGIVLSVCDLEKLRQELLIDPADWHLIHKLLTCLRSSTTDGVSIVSETSQKRVSRMSSHESELAELTSGHHSAHRSKHQQPQHQLNNQTLVTQIPLLHFEKSDSKQKTANAFPVRQTPWLISPKIPITTLSSNGKTYEPFQEFPCQQRPSPDSSDQQNSCSLMEEPESLWKNNNNLQSVPSNVDKSLSSSTLLPPQQISRLYGLTENPQQLGHSSAFSNVESFGRLKDIKLSEKHSRRSDPLTSMTGGKEASKYTFNKDTQKSLQSNLFAIKNGYASRSSVDLRTVFGPEQKATSSAQLLSNYTVIKNSKRNRVKRALIEQHKRRQQQCLLTQTPNFNYLMDPRFYHQPFVGAASNQSANLFTHELLNQTGLPFDPRLQSTKLPSTKRFIRQPRHKYDYQTHMNDTAVQMTNGSKNVVGAEHPNHMINLTASNAHIQQNCLYESPNNYESETDESIQSPDNKNAHLNFSSQKHSLLNHLKHCPPSFHTPTVFPSPALTPGQLASLQSYAAWSSKMNPYFANPTVLGSVGPVLPNTYLKQHQANIFSQAKTSTHLKSDHKAFRPSQKKRPRKNNSEDENNIIVNPNTEFFPSGVTNPHLYSLPIPCDSETEMCTCDYWFEVEKAREKFTISEPSLRAESDLISVDDFVQENGSQSSEAGGSLKSVNISPRHKGRLSK
ncbi:unnamed protein product [Trichobilharzia szidati]|nr:unnamed protein product [Trichobilharzia szidati]